MVEMIKLDDETYIPRECCTVTNPLTSGGESEIDDIDMPCGADCDGECSECVVQKIMNEYATLTMQKIPQAIKNLQNRKKAWEDESFKDRRLADAHIKSLDRAIREVEYLIK